MIFLKTTKEIKIMREGGLILADILKKLEKKIKVGISTKELEYYCQKFISKFGLESAFKGYEGFPSVLCTSLNEEIVHCPPSAQKKIKKGDILKIDIGIKYQEFFLDMARSYPVGEISFDARRLIKIGKKSLKLAIKKARVGNTIGDISNTIQRYVEAQGFNVIRELFGHGIGKNLHEEPVIPNFGKRKSGPKLMPGMVLCIEPMISAGDWKLERTVDGFGFKTKDNSLTVHFEDTIAVTKKGPLNLTGKNL